MQLGLRGETLRRYATSELLAIEDLTEFVAAQRAHASATGHLSQLVTPLERVYVPDDRAATEAVGIEDAGGSA